MLRVVTRTQVVLHERKLCYIAPGFISKKNNHGKIFQNDITVPKTEKFAAVASRKAS